MRRARKDGGGERNLRDLIAATVKLAVADATDGLPASAAASLVAKIDNVGCPGTFLDEMCHRVNAESPYPNLPAAVARAVGASIGADGCLSSGPSGNTPQAFVNHFAEKIAAGRAEVCDNRGRGAQCRDPDEGLVWGGATGYQIACLANMLESGQKLYL